MSSYDFEIKDITKEVYLSIDEMVVSEHEKELYEPIFREIRIFGSKENPLFVTNDVKTLLKLSDFNLSKKGDYVEDLHYKMIDVPTGTGGIRKMNAFTEMGLYKAMFSSKVDIARKFCEYITIVMKQLRLTGIVTLESSYEEYKKSAVKMIEDNSTIIKKLEHDNNVLADALYEIEDNFLLEYCRNMENMFMKKEQKLIINLEHNGFLSEGITKEDIDNEDLSSEILVIRIGTKLCKNEVAVDVVRMIDPVSQLKEPEFYYNISNDNSAKSTIVGNGMLYTTISDAKRIVRNSNNAYIINKLQS